MIKESVIKLAEKIYPEVVNIRRQIHSCPELGFEEYETAKLVSKKLTEFGIEHQTGIAKTGVVGMIRGKNPDKRCIALRADMDALPITETNSLPYKSKNEGKMHACGHDFHTASLLGTAYILNHLKHEIEGSVKLIFQPSEEKEPGGAKVMIQEGVLEHPKVDVILGQHVSPELQCGTVGFRKGKFMASTDEIYMTVKGKGGHAAYPHKLIDPVLITAHILVSAQQIVSRFVPADIPVVLSFGDIHGNGATNIIPNEVKVKGTLRTFDETWRDNILDKLKSLTHGIAQSMGGTVELHLPSGYPSLSNDATLTDKVKSNAENYSTNLNIVDVPLRMGGEDFAFFSQVVPSCFYRIGTGNEKKGTTFGLHTPTFNVDEDALKHSTGLMAWTVLSAFD